MRAPLIPFSRLQSERKAQAIDRSHRCLGRFDPCMRPGQQDHRIDMVSVHVREDARRGLGQRVRGSMFVVLGLDPSHHAKASDVVEIDGLEPEEAEVGEVDPVAAILVASEVSLPNASYIVLRHRFGIADQGCPGGPKRITVGPCLPDEEAASGVGLQVLGVHGHIADEEDGPPGRIEREGHQRTEGKTRMLAGNRRQGGNRG